MPSAAPERERIGFHSLNHRVRRHTGDPAFACTRDSTLETSEATSDANSEATLKTTTEGGPRKVETLSDLLGKRPGLTMGLECTFWR